MLESWGWKGERRDGVNGLAPGVTKTVTLGAPPGVTRGLSGTVGDSPRAPGGDIAPPRLQFAVLAENCAGGALYYISLF